MATGVFRHVESPMIRQRTKKLLLLLATLVLSASAVPTNAVTRTFKSRAVPVGPSKAACDPKTALDLGYLANVGDSNIYVFNLTSDEIIGSISGFRQPWNVNISPDGRTLFVDDMPALSPSKCHISVVDTCTGNITQRFPTDGLAIGSMPAHGRELLTAKYFRYEIEVLNTLDRTVNAAYKTKAIPMATVADEEGDVIWATGAPNIVYKIDRHTGKSTEDTPIRTSLFAQQLALTPDRKTLAVAHSTGITLIDTDAHQIRKSVSVTKDYFGSAAYGGFTSDGKHLWMAYFSGQVLVIDMANETVVAEYDTGGQAIGTTFSRDGSKVYVSTTPPGSIYRYIGMAYPFLNFFEIWKPGGVLRVYDTKTFKEIREIKVGNGPQALAIAGVAK